MNTAHSPAEDIDVEPAPPVWAGITCAQYEEELRALGEDRVVYSSLTDISGTFGAPRIETVWARAADPDRPALRGVRHPNEDGSGAGPDARPCTHFIAS